MRSRSWCLLFLPALVWPPAAGAQGPRRLQDALRLAEMAAYPNRIAAGEADARAGEALAPYRGLLPSVRLEAGYVRTTDPLSAFGFTLRQRVVTAGAFAPAALNDPSAVGNLGTGVMIDQPLFNADAWLGRKAARQSAAAAVYAERWTHATTAIGVVRAYWGAVLAHEQERTLASALEAAQSQVRDAESMVRQGLATKSDALLATVKAGDAEASLLGARSQAGLARRALAMEMGDPGDTAFALPDSLPSPERIRAIVDAMTDGATSPAARSDVAASRSVLVAARADAARARSLFLPRLNSFGRVEWNSSGTPFGGRRAWTAGIMLSWSPFAGASELAEIRAARGRETAARAAADAAEGRAELELAQTREAVAVTRARLDIAERAVAQAREAHRIVARKYAGGVATVTELFEAAAAETAVELRFSSSRYDLITTIGERLTSQGRDLSPLFALDD